MVSLYRRKGRTDIKKDFMPTYQAERAFEVQLQEDLKTLVEKTEELDGVGRAAIIPPKVACAVWAMCWNEYDTQIDNLAIPTV